MTNLCSKISCESPQSFKAAARSCLKSSDEKFLKLCNLTLWFFILKARFKHCVNHDDVDDDDDDDDDDDR